MDKYCRSCFRKDEFDVFPLDAVSQVCGVRIDDMLVYCTQLEIDLEDDLPQQICAECLSALNAAFLFRKHCYRSESNLREMQNLTVVNSLEEMPFVTEELELPNEPTIDLSQLAFDEITIKQEVLDTPPQPCDVVSEEPANPSVEPIEESDNEGCDNRYFLINNRLLYVCDDCKYATNSKGNFKRHWLGPLHAKNKAFVKRMQNRIPTKSVSRRRRRKLRKQLQDPDGESEPTTEMSQNAFDGVAIKVEAADPSQNEGLSTETTRVAADKDIDTSYDECNTRCFLINGRKIYICDDCKYATSLKGNFRRHWIGPLHAKNKAFVIKMQKRTPIRRLVKRRRRQKVKPRAPESPSNSNNKAEITSELVNKIAQIIKEDEQIERKETSESTKLTPGEISKKRMKDLLETKCYLVNNRKVYICEECKYVTTQNGNYRRHCRGRVHIKNMAFARKMQKRIPFQFRFSDKKRMKPDGDDIRESPQAEPDEAEPTPDEPTNDLSLATDDEDSAEGSETSERPPSIIAAEAEENTNYESYESRCFWVNNRIIYICDECKYATASKCNFKRHWVGRYHAENVEMGRKMLEKMAIVKKKLTNLVEPDNNMARDVEKDSAVQDTSQVKDEPVSSTKPADEIAHDEVAISDETAKESSQFSEVNQNETAEIASNETGETSGYEMCDSNVYLLKDRNYYICKDCKYATTDKDSFKRHWLGPVHARIETFVRKMRRRKPVTKLNRFQKETSTADRTDTNSTDGQSSTASDQILEDPINADDESVSGNELNETIEIKPEHREQPSPEKKAKATKRLPKATIIALSDEMLDRRCFIINNKKMYVCDKCKYNTNTKYNFRRHCKQHARNVDQFGLRMQKRKPIEARNQSQKKPKLE